jgi:hypothetical protein
MMSVTQFATLEKRVVQVEAQLHDRERERTGSANRPG